MNQTFPDLSTAKAIAIDTEGCDPDLLTKGPGSHRGSYTCGISVATEDGFAEYYPIRHEGGDNLDPEKVFAWLRKELCRPNQLKVGANITYDLEFLHHEGVPVTGPFYDVQYAEPLLNEHKFDYSLDAIAKQYMGEGKDSDGMYKWLSEHFGGKPIRPKQAPNIWRAPGEIVRSYAISDAVLPLQIMRKQLPLLQAQDLMSLLDLEHRLIPLLLMMRKRGVRVDLEKAQLLSDILGPRITEGKQELYRLCGREINIHAAVDIAPVFDALNISYPTTAKTRKPSFTQAWFDVQTHPIATLLNRVRKDERAKETFIDGYILNAHIEGRVYGSFHPLRSNDKGTISGRFSSSNPNLENVPTRDKMQLEIAPGVSQSLGKAIRSLFLPEEGEDFCKNDYSQIEYRIIAHYGGKTISQDPAVIRRVLESAEEVRKAYTDNPDTDFHQWCADISGKDRTPAKTLNFGKAYGMGLAAIAVSLNMPLKEAKAFATTYNDRVPFIDELLKYVGAVADQRGYIKTILGRRARFDWFEPKYNYGKEKPKLYEDAVKQWGKKGICRAKTYKALNALAQGTAADVFKTALVKCMEAGIYDVIGAPLNLVHDEQDTSRPRTKVALEAHKEMIHIMETAIPFKLPLKVECEVGANWGEVTLEEEE